MGKKVTLGGDRLGSGKKMKVNLHNYNRSSHDLGYIWRSSMAPGTLVPCLNITGLPGDTFDIDINAVIRTLPTVGPMFGSFKMQLDLFNCPMRLYNAKLHNNALGIGMNMASIKLPQMVVKGHNLLFDGYIPLERQQINPSCILSYLGIKGLGQMETGDNVERLFNAVPFLAYWDIYKNYYANKQEEIGTYIRTSFESLNKWDTLFILNENGSTVINNSDVDFSYTRTNSDLYDLKINKGAAGYPIGANIKYKVAGIYYELLGPTGFKVTKLNTTNKQYDIISFVNSEDVTGFSPIQNFSFQEGLNQDCPILLDTFDLNNLDTMRESILAHTSAAAYLVGEASIEPYSSVLSKFEDLYYAAQVGQEGLAIKTYQSDIFNNWLNTEWIDGTNGIAAITSIDTSAGEFALDTLNMAKKVYDMLNRIAVSGGTYNDWIETVYTSNVYGKSETPMYLGGLSKEVVFQEVVSNAATADEPLGTLGGKGTMSGKHKGGFVRVKCDEPCVILGIVSLTPRIDYSQGNQWDVNLKTLDDLHKPALDEIGFQELLTDQMAFWDTRITGTNTPVFRSAGKQPAWINYMTNYNRCHGNFADVDKEMYMTLNRRYEANIATKTISDLTTYIDPSKFNYMFAQTSLDSQNFWAQISFDITARRVMSARIMPNL